MINCPPDFPVSARALVERAISDEEDDFIAVSAGGGPVRSALLPGDVTYPGMWDTSDRAAVSYVVAVFATVAQASCDAAREGNWPAEKLRTTTVDFLDQLTQLAYAHKHSKRDRGFGPMTLDDFTTIVHREVRTFEFWSGLQDTIRELAGTAAQADPALPAWSRLHQELKRPSVTLQLLWLEIAAGTISGTTSRSEGSRLESDRSNLLERLVPEEGVEPTLSQGERDFESRASASSATPARTSDYTAKPPTVAARGARLRRDDAQLRKVVSIPPRIARQQRVAGHRRMGADVKIRQRRTTHPAVPPVLSKGLGG